MDTRRVLNLARFWTRRAEAQTTADRVIVWFCADQEPRIAGAQWVSGRDLVFRTPQGRRVFGAEVHPSVRRSPGVVEEPLGKGAESRGLAVHLLSATQGVSVLAHVFHDPELISIETARLKEWIRAL